jgi:hypothetical protein
MLFHVRRALAGESNVSFYVEGSIKRDWNGVVEKKGGVVRVLGLVEIT